MVLNPRYEMCYSSKKKHTGSQEENNLKVAFFWFIYSLLSRDPPFWASDSDESELEVPHFLRDRKTRTMQCIFLK